MASCFLEGDLHGGQPLLPQRHRGSSQIDWCQLAMEALLSYSPSEPPTPLSSRLTHFLKLCSKYFTEKVWRGPTGLPNHEGGGLSREQRKVFKLCVSFCRVQSRILPLELSPKPVRDVLLHLGLRPDGEMFHATDKALSPCHLPAALGYSREIGYISPTFLCWRSLNP